MRRYFKTILFMTSFVLWQFSYAQSSVGELTAFSSPGDHSRYVEAGKISKTMGKYMLSRLLQEKKVKAFDLEISLSLGRNGYEKMMSLFNNSFRYYYEISFKLDSPAGRPVHCLGEVSYDESSVSRCHFVNDLSYEPIDIVPRVYTQDLYNLVTSSGPFDRDAKKVN